MKSAGLYLEDLWPKLKAVMESSEEPLGAFEITKRAGVSRYNGLWALKRAFQCNLVHIKLVRTHPNHHQERYYL